MDYIGEDKVSLLCLSHGISVVRGLRVSIIFKLVAYYLLSSIVRCSLIKYTFILMHLKFIVPRLRLGVIRGERVIFIEVSN